MKELRGKPVCEAIEMRIREDIKMLSVTYKKPKIAIVRVGERTDDLSYERRLVKKCEQLGVAFEINVFDAQIPDSEFRRQVRHIDSDPSVDGILLFRPLPDHIDYEKAISAVSIDKDIDAMRSENLGLTLTGTNKGFTPCTAEAVVEILKHYEIPIAGSQICIVNNSNVIGKPLAMMLTNLNATPYICNKFTRNIKDVTKKSDVVITAIGKPKFFGSEFFDEQQYVIDVGINLDSKGDLCGDVDYEPVKRRSAGITPVPGGVGTVTTAILIRNVVKACRKKMNQNYLEVS